MSQRLIAAVVAAPLLAALIATVALVKVPYVRYQPGLTVDVLGAEGGKDIIKVQGARTYRDDGQLRLTTVYVSPPDGGVGVFTALDAWLDPEDALYPYDTVYPDNESQEDADQRSSAQMVSSQDTAVAVALSEMGYDVPQTAEVLAVSEGMPADGKLKVRDRLLRIGDTRIRSVEDVFTAVGSAEAGTPLEFVVQRGSERRTVSVTPKSTPDGPKVGVVPGIGFDFPFEVSVALDPNIGGPSAGLMFSLGVYDVLTPGSLTGSRTVAGTGTIDAEGRVGPIGGIQQKIVAAEDAGARLFLVPPDNCAEAMSAPAGDMRLVRTPTMSAAVKAVEKWTENPDAPLPRCSKEAA